MTATCTGPDRPCLLESAGPAVYALLVTLLIVGALLATVAL